MSRPLKLGGWGAGDRTLDSTGRSTRCFALLLETAYDLRKRKLRGDRSYPSFRAVSQPPADCVRTASNLRPPPVNHQQHEDGGATDDYLVIHAACAQPHRPLTPYPLTPDQLRRARLRFAARDHAPRRDRGRLQGVRAPDLPALDLLSPN